jgi:hypothetical protein
MSDGGKGDKARPLSIPKEEFDNRWDIIFKKKEQDESKRLPDGDKEATDIRGMEG